MGMEMLYAKISSWSVVAAVWSDNFPSKTADEKSKKNVEQDERRLTDIKGWSCEGRRKEKRKKNDESCRSEKKEEERADETSSVMVGRGWGKEILRHVTALFSDFITVLANLISERRHNITIYEWERKGIHGNGHIYYELRPRAFRTQPAPWALSTCHYVKYIRYVRNFELFPHRIYCLLFVERCLLSSGFIWPNKILCEFRIVDFKHSFYSSWLWDWSTVWIWPFEPQKRFQKIFTDWGMW